MSAEEYIQSESTTFESPNIDSTTEIVETFIAIKAIKMARMEEREKAIEIVKTAYKNALYECKTNKGTYQSPIYIFEDLMKNCDKLLNQ